jgi:hypothetical protein
MNAQPAMTPHARRCGLEALRGVLRRHNPGFDAVFELERDDRAGDTSAGEIGRRLAAPEDAGPVSDRIDVAATTAGTAHHHAVDESGEHFAPLVDGEA